MQLLLGRSRPSFFNAELQRLNLGFLRPCGPMPFNRARWKTRLVSRSSSAALGTNSRCGVPISDWGIPEPKSKSPWKWSGLGLVSFMRGVLRCWETSGFKLLASTASEQRLGLTGQKYVLRCGSYTVPESCYVLNTTFFPWQGIRQGFAQHLDPSGPKPERVLVRVSGVSLVSGALGFHAEYDKEETNPETIH